MNTNRTCAKGLILLMAVIMIFSGCSNDNQGMIGGQEEKNTGYYALTYLHFTGNRNVVMKLESPKTISIRVLTNSGDLHMSIMGEDENGVVVPQYVGKNLQTGKSDLELDAGEYTVEIDAYKHSGSFSITYR